MPIADAPDPGQTPLPPAPKRDGSRGRIAPVLCVGIGLVVTFAHLAALNFLLPLTTSDPLIVLALAVPGLIAMMLRRWSFVRRAHCWVALWVVTVLSIAPQLVLFVGESWIADRLSGALEPA